MQQAITGQGVSTGMGTPTLQIREPAAGFLDQHEGSGKVPRGDLRFQHRFASAFGNQDVAPEVTETSRSPCGAEDCIETTTTVAAVKDLRVCEG